jgi:signal transduction histidine kinase
MTATGRRDRVVDVTLGVATTVIVSAAAVAKVSPQRPATAGVFLFAAGFGLLMLGRRRWPVGVLLAAAAGLIGYYILDFPPVGLALPLGAALFSAAQAGRWRAAAAVGAALVVVSTVARAMTGETTAYLLGYELPITVAVMGAAIAFGDGLRSRRRFAAAVRAAADADREHQVEQDRLRVARDVHDVLAHTMSVVSLHADVAAESLDAADVAAARTALGHIRAASSDAGRELRRTVGLLREPCGGVHRLPELAQVSGTAGVPVRIRVQGARRRLPPRVDEVVYRVVQEAVTNARRHARPDRVDVLVDYAPRQVRVVVADDGPATGAAGGGGQGLTGMRERVSALGGRLHAGPVPPSGFRVEAVLPA